MTDSVSRGASGSSNGAATPVDPTPAGSGRSIARVLGLGVGVLIVGVLGFALNERWQELPPEALNPDTPRLMLSLALLLAGILLGALLWRSVLVGIGVPLSIAESVYIHCISQAGKYIPGKAFLVVGKVMLTAQQGKPTGQAAASVVYELAFFLMGGLLIVLGCGALADISALNPYRIWILAVAIAGVGAVHPSVMGRFFRLIQRVSQSKIEVPALAYGPALRILIGFTVPWLVVGAGFYVFVTAFAPLEIRLVPDMIAVLAIAGLFSFVALFAPAGLGVREVTLTALLAIYLPQSVSLAIPLAFRVAVTLVDLVAVAIGLVLRPHCVRLAEAQSK